MSKTNIKLSFHVGDSWRILSKCWEFCCWFKVFENGAHCCKNIPSFLLEVLPPNEINFIESRFGILNCLRLTLLLRSYQFLWYEQEKRKINIMKAIDERILIIEFHKFKEDSWHRFGSLISWDASLMIIFLALFLNSLGFRQSLLHHPPFWKCPDIFSLSFSSLSHFWKGTSQTPSTWRCFDPSLPQRLY